MRHSWSREPHSPICICCVAPSSNPPRTELTRSARHRSQSSTALKFDRCPRLAQSGHPSLVRQCPLLGVKQTSDRGASMSAFDPKGTSSRSLSSNKSVVYLRRFLASRDRGPLSAPVIEISPTNQTISSVIATAKMYSVAVMRPLNRAHHTGPIRRRDQ